ncbi:MAG: ABC transporter ATP-binding protein [Bacteroidetes bacterium SW_8_64_56]|jgi:phospholipid/cholesterol/gamma-HCH transport system ATP-binding protein|nr:MAG: ABC transporter ATP-binding protein [Bacteroidetes bacterium QS_4_64_154]PSR02609.1 MAG: ABC transporter ATP-binding protein [Bacteroidetes bacterium SW_8_64_56]
MIDVQNISKSFGSLHVLDDVSLEVHDGEKLAIIGRSGSGKSVLMKHLVGLLKPDTGHVYVDGEDLCCASYERLRELRKRFGVLFQGGALFDSMSTSDNIAFPLRYFSSLSEAEVQTRVQECLDLVRLSDIGAKNPAELSGGMRKRVGLARTIALEPQYILYDEPTSGLDPETSNTINDLINHLAGELNVTSVVITHDMHSVLAVADRVAFLYGQDLEWVGPVENVHDCANPNLNSFVKASQYTIGASAASPPVSESSA